MQNLDKLKNQFKFKFYLNSKHSVQINDNFSGVHNHTWEVTIFLNQNDKEFNEFNTVEKKITEYLSTYNKEIINLVAPFDKINPIMENMGQVFFEEIEKTINSNIYSLVKIEISENPTRSYIVRSYLGYESLENEEFEFKMKKHLGQKLEEKLDKKDLKSIKTDSCLEVYTVLKNMHVKIEEEKENKKLGKEIIESIGWLMLIIIGIVIVCLKLNIIISLFKFN